MIDEVPKFGNAYSDDVDYFARDVAYTYTRPLQKYHNPRGGQYPGRTLSGICECSAWRTDRCYSGWHVMHIPRLQMVFLRQQVRMSTDRQQQQASVARLDHFIVSNGTLFNQKFHPSALAGREGLEKFVALIRTYFDQKGMHMQFNVVEQRNSA